jgi:hypothetical protein
MSVNRQVYDFAAKAGALEGWVYKREVDVSYLPMWIQHLVDLYGGLPEDVRTEIQDMCNETVGRTIQSLLPFLGEEHELMKKLRGMTVGKIPSDPDDFPVKRLPKQ